MATDFGHDLACVSDLAPDLRSVSGRRALSEALARRLSTGRGKLLDDPNYGYDLTQYLGDDLSPGDLAAVRAGAEAECSKDERVNGVIVTVTKLPLGQMTVTVSIDDATGTFQLVLAVSAVTVDILSLTS